MWTTSVTLTFIIALAMRVAEPVLLACISYAPGGTRRKLNLPDSSEVADLFVPVPWLIKRTMALGKTAPEGSKAIPVKAPVDAVWAETYPASNTAIAAILNEMQRCEVASGAHHLKKSHIDKTLHALLQEASSVWRGPIA